MRTRVREHLHRRGDRDGELPRAPRRVRLARDATNRRAASIAAKRPSVRVRRRMRMRMRLWTRTRTRTDVSRVGPARDSRGPSTRQHARQRVGRDRWWGTMSARIDRGRRRGTKRERARGRGDGDGDGDGSRERRSGPRGGRARAVRPRAFVGDEGTEDEDEVARLGFGLGEGDLASRLVVFASRASLIVHEGAALLGEIVDDRALLAHLLLGRLELAEEVEDERGELSPAAAAAAAARCRRPPGSQPPESREGVGGDGVDSEVCRNASSEGTSRTIIRFPMPSVHTSVVGPMSPSRQSARSLSRDAAICAGGGSGRSGQPRSEKPTTNNVRLASRDDGDAPGAPRRETIDKTRVSTRAVPRRPTSSRAAPVRRGRRT